MPTLQDLKDIDGAIETARCEELSAERNRAKVQLSREKTSATLIEIACEFDRYYKDPHVELLEVIAELRDDILKTVEHRFAMKAQAARVRAMTLQKQLYAYVTPEQPKEPH